MCAMNAISESADVSISFDDENFTKVDGTSEWLEGYIESENLFLQYLKSLTMTVDSEIPVEVECDDMNWESGWEALDNLYDLLVSICDQSFDSEIDHEIQHVENHRGRQRKVETKTKRAFKCLSSNYGKESLQVKQNRGRSHSSVGMDEILRSQTISDINAESRRKSRRVSLGMRPRFSNWSKVKDAFKRDKSCSRIDSKDTEEYPDVTSYSGDEGLLGRVDPHSSSSHGNTTQISSSDEEFEYYAETFPPDNVPNKYLQEFTNGDEFLSEVQDIDNGDYYTECSPLHAHHMRILGERRVVSENNSPVCQKPFKWRNKLKNGASSSVDSSCCQEIHLSAPPSPMKSTSGFLYDDETIDKLIDVNREAEDVNRVSMEDTNEALREVQERYEYLRKQLSSEFNEKYNEWNPTKRSLSGTIDDEDQLDYANNDSKLSLYLADCRNHFTPTFRQRFQEWQRMKGISPTRTKYNKSNSPNLSKKQKTDWHKWRPGSKSESNVLRFLEYKDSDDTLPQETIIISEDNDDEDINSQRILKQGVKSHNDKKELAWLEKELQKVAREKQRLEKEKEKYAERENRLQNMKKAIKSGRKRKQEILVPTSTGLFRFQGISSKFTRKLYEWEKARGISAESSTFALLDPYYSPVLERSTKQQATDMMISMQRSRSVGSVDTTGVSSSTMQHIGTVSHQQSSLSLNDMEELEEAHLRESKLSRSGSRLFDDTGEDIQTVTIEEIPDISGNRYMKEIRNPTCDEMYSINFAQNEDADRLPCRKQSSEYDSDAENIVFQDITNQSSVQLRRESANADAENIVKQIQTLRAGTSIDDEDRINTLTKLQQLADQLLFMVSEMDSKRTECIDEPAAQIAKLVIELKEEIKKLSLEELHVSLEPHKENCNIQRSHKAILLPTEDHKHICQSSFIPEGIYSDIEDNDSSTLHCTFKLPARRRTPSSTESESSNRKNNSRITPVTEKVHYPYDIEENNSSGGDENYDGEDETTVYVDLRPIKSKVKNRYPREPDYISTSNSDEKIIFDETNYEENRKPFIKDSDEEELEKEVDTAVRYGSPKLGSKKKCIFCGKTRRLLKGKRIPTNNYCSCSRKDLYLGEKLPTTETVVLETISDNLYPHGKSIIEDYGNKVAELSDVDTPKISKRKMGKISRSKIYDFNCENTSKITTKNNSSEKGNEKLDQTVSVIVPTTRTIFAPVKQDENGSLSTVVSYMVDDERKEHNCNLYEKEIDDRQGQNYKNNSLLMPPSWSLKEARSKSVSPSFGRKDKLNENFETENIINDNNKEIENKYQNETIQNKAVKNIVTNTKSDEVLFRKEKNPTLKAGIVTDKLPPASPSISKRSIGKETNNSSIKLMVARYNKLMSEKPERRVSEGNCWSPTIQKSPVLERRAHFEHLQNETDKGNVRKSKSAILNKTDGQPVGRTNGRNFDGISKSSSVGVINLGQLTVMEPTNRDLKIEINFDDSKQFYTDFNLAGKMPRSPGTGSLISTSNSNQTENEYDQMELLTGNDRLGVEQRFPVSMTENYKHERDKNSSFENLLNETKMRSLRLQEAREKFFNSNSVSSSQSQSDFPKLNSDLPSYTKIINENLDPPKNSSVLHVDANFNSVILSKSISTGAIDDRIHNIPSSCNIVNGEKDKSSKTRFGLSSIASKFRKAKIKRHRDHEMSAVSSLCKASLLLNINDKKENIQNESFAGPSKSCPSTPIPLRKILAKRNSSSN